MLQVLFILWFSLAAGMVRFSKENFNKANSLQVLQGFAFEFIILLLGCIVTLFRKAFKQTEVLS